MSELDTRYDETTAFLESHADRALRDANNFARRISNQPKPDLSDPRVNVDLKKPNLQQPPKFSDLFPDADGTSEEVSRLNGMVDEWISDYFPSINDCFRTVPDEWLCNIISGKNPFGLHESVFEAVWHQARDQQERTMRSEEASLRANFSERGFSLPPGAYVAAVDQSRERASEAIQEVVRQEAIRNEEIKLQLLQFAVEQATRYKLGIMSSLSDFYRTWVTIPNQEIERARVRAQAYSSLYSALSTYYNVEVAFEDLRLKAAGADVDAQLGADRNKVALYGANTASGALAQAVRGFASVSAEAASAAGSLIAQIEGV